MIRDNTTTISQSASLGEPGRARSKNRQRMGQSLSNPQVRRRLAQIPDLYKGAYKRVIQAKASPHEAIQAQCLECVGWVRKEVTLCTDLGCPLYPYRPYQLDTP